MARYIPMVDIASWIPPFPATCFESPNPNIELLLPDNYSSLLFLIETKIYCILLLSLRM